MEKEKIIIIGASGLVGGYLYNFLKKEDFEAMGTYFKNPKEGLIYFDLANSKTEELGKAGYAIICSAVAKIDECRKNPEYSYKINVENTKRLIKEFSEKNTIPVFISGAAVFDNNGNYKEDDFRNPANEYGKQKKEVEDFIMENIKKFLIIRLGKVFGCNENEGVFGEWIEKYKNNEEIPCIYDGELSLTYAGDIARGIIELIKRNKNGIFHIDSGIHKSRYQFAEDFFNYLNIDNAKIKKLSVKDFNFLDKRAKSQYLDSSKFIKETSFEFTSIEECYGMIKEKFSENQE